MYRNAKFYKKSHFLSISDFLLGNIHRYYCYGHVYKICYVLKFNIQ
jgi:hypothetical protein